MTDVLATNSKAKSRRKAPAGRLFALEVSRGWIRSMNADGSDRKVIFQGVHQLMGSDLGPAWAETDPQSRGLEASGQRLVLLFGGILVLAVTLIPSALVAGGITLVTRALGPIGPMLGGTMATAGGPAGRSSSRRTS